MTHSLTRWPAHAVRGIFRLLAATAVALSLNPPAMALTPASTEAPKEDSTMTTATARIQPRLSAEQALRRLLELIRTSHSIDEFTPQRLQEVMGVPVDTWEKDHYGFGERLTPQWFYGFEVDSTGEQPRERRFDFSFNPHLNTSTPMTDICQIDFEQFSAELQKMGFSRAPYYDSPPFALNDRDRLPHGRRMYDVFGRAGMRIQVSPEGEADEPIEKISHLCVKMVLID